MGETTENSNESEIAENSVIESINNEETIPQEPQDKAEELKLENPQNTISDSFDSAAIERKDN